MRTRRKRLELEAQAKLHLARVIALSADYTPASWVCRIEARIEEYRVVEHVGDYILEFEAGALIDLDILRNSQVHVPVHQAADFAYAARTSIQTEDGVTDGVVERCRICEGTERASTLVVVQ